MLFTHITQINLETGLRDVYLTSRVTACHIPIPREMGFSSQKLRHSHTDFLSKEQTVKFQQEMLHHKG